MASSRMEAFLSSTLPEWNDDAICQLMYNDFSYLEEANKEAFESRIRFWRAAIDSSLGQGLLGESVFVFSTADLAQKFKRKGVIPMGLRSVLVRLARENDRERRSVPAKALEYVISSLLSLVIKEEPTVPATICLLSRLDETAKAIASSSWSGNALTLEEFERLYEANVKVAFREDLALVLNRMAEKSLVALYDLHTKQPIVGQVDVDSVCRVAVVRPSIKAVREVEKAQIRVCLRNLHSLIDRMQAMFDASTRRAAALAQRDQKSAAISELQKRKTLQSFISGRMAQINNLELITIRLEGLESDKVVLASYEAGSAALKTALAEVDIDAVDKIYDEIADLTDRYQEVSEALSQAPPMASADMDDLAAELSEIVQDMGKKEAVAPQPPHPTPVAAAEERSVADRQAQLEE